MICRRCPWAYGLLALLITLSACEQESNRKIKLSAESSLAESRVRTVSSTLEVDPEEQHTIAIIPFANHTKDPALDWLSRGLADMLTQELSQSIYLNVLGLNRLNESAKLLGKEPSSLEDLDNALQAAQHANVKTIVRGSFAQDDGMLKIHGVLQDVETREVVKTESVQGPNLERIFSMVDDLSNRLAADLRGDLQSPTKHRRSLAAMTQSIEAFKCYSLALDNLEKYFYAEADKCLSEAIAIDSTFAAAYLLQCKTKAAIGNHKAIPEKIRGARQYADKLTEADQIWLRLIEAQLDGDVARMLTVMQELLSFEPHDLDTRLDLADLRYKLGDLERAVEEYELIIEMDPTRRRAYNQVAYAFARRGDFATAEMYLDKYAEVAPEEPNPYDSKGEVLAMQGRFDEAADQLKIALEKRPNFYDSARKLSQIYSELDDLEKSLYYSDKWLAGAPGPSKQSVAYTARAAALWRFGKIAEAEKTIALAREFAPNVVAPAFVGGEMHKVMGDTSAARDLYEAYFRRYQHGAYTDTLDLEELFGALRLVMEADLPPPLVIPALKRFAEKESRPFIKQMIEIHLGLLYLRNGEHELAKKYCDNQSREFLDFLTHFPAEGRSVSWKYSIEAIRLEPLEKDLDLSYLDDIIKAGQESGRKDIEVMGRLLKAQYHGKYNRNSELHADYAAVGVPLEDAWRIIGPFENRSGFQKTFGPENEINLEATYTRRGRTLRWQPVNDGAYDGFVDLRTMLQPSSWGVAYGAVAIHSPEKRKVQLRVASDEACKLWLNNKLVWQIYRTRESPLDSDIISVVLHPGDNNVLIKVTNSREDWGFYLRVTDERGDGFRDIKFHAPGEEGNAFAARPVRPAMD